MRVNPIPPSGGLRYDSAVVRQETASVSPRLAVVAMRAFGGDGPVGEHGDRRLTEGEWRVRLHLPGLGTSVGRDPELAPLARFGAYATTFAGERGAFPMLVSSHRAVEVRSRYEFSAGLALTARAYEEAHRAADWAIDGIEPDNIRNVLTLRRSSVRYRNRVVAVSVERKNTRQC